MFDIKFPLVLYNCETWYLTLRGTQAQGI